MCISFNFRYFPGLTIGFDRIYGHYTVVDSRNLSCPRFKMTNVSWQSDGFSSLSCGLPCSLAPPYPKGSSSLAIVSLDGGGGKVKVEAEGFPSGILLAAASLNAHTILLVSIWV